MRTAALFPGHGSQEEDPTETLARVRPDLLEPAQAELGDNGLERAAESTAYAAEEAGGEGGMLALSVSRDVGEALKELTGLVKRTLDGDEATTARRLAGAGV